MAEAKKKARRGLDGTRGDPFGGRSHAARGARSRRGPRQPAPAPGRGRADRRAPAQVRPGAIELHPDEVALVVHYEVVLAQPDGSQAPVSGSHGTKKVTVKSLSERTDLEALAAEVVDRCKLIHPSKAGLVQGLLQQLLRRHLQQQQQQQVPTVSGQHQLEQQQAPGQQAQPGAAAHAPAAAASLRPGSAAPRPGSGRPASAQRPSSRGQQQQQQQQQQQLLAGSPGSYTRRRLPLQADDDEVAAAAAAAQLTQRVVVQASDIFEALPSPPPAFIEDLDALLEGLYDDAIAARAAAAGGIAALFRDARNHEACAARGRGAASWRGRGRGPRRPRRRARRGAGGRSARGAGRVARAQASSANRARTQVGTLLMDLASLELLQRAPAREAAEGPGSTPGVLAARAAAAAAAAAPPLGERERRLAGLVCRQDRFLHLAVATLANLAEDPAVARKMHKRDVVALLAALLGRPHVELLCLGVTFMRRLCIYSEAKDRLASLPGVVPALLGLLSPGCGAELAGGAARLLHNLSFDEALRCQMVAGGLVPLASIDDGAKAAFVFCPSALPRLYGSLLRAMGGSQAGGPGSGGGGGGDAAFAGFAGALSGGGGGGCDLRSVPELIALAWFCAGERLERLLRRCLASGDELGWKLVRNLVAAGGEDAAARVLGQAGDMMALLQARAARGGQATAVRLPPWRRWCCVSNGPPLQDPAVGPELFLEVLGVLAAACDALSNAPARGGDGGEGGGSALGRLLDPEPVTALLQGCLRPGALEDDALLEAVVLLGALAGTPEFDGALAASGLLAALVGLVADKRADNEFVLQVVPYLIDLLQDSCPPVRRLVGACLDAAMDASEALAGTIRSLKFEAHNQDWLALAGPQASALMAAAAAAAAAAGHACDATAPAAGLGRAPGGEGLQRGAAPGSLAAGVTGAAQRMWGGAGDGTEDAAGMQWLPSGAGGGDDGGSLGGDAWGRGVAGEGSGLLGPGGGLQLQAGGQRVITAITAMAQASRQAARRGGTRWLLLLALVAVALRGAGALNLKAVCPDQSDRYCYGKDAWFHTYYLWTVYYDNCDPTEYDFAGDGSSIADCYIRGRHSNMISAYCNILGANCNPCGSCGRSYTGYSTALNKIVTGPGLPHTACPLHAHRAAGACDTSCTNAYTAGGCAPCGATARRSSDAVAPDATPSSAVPAHHPYHPRDPHHPPAPSPSPAPGPSPGCGDMDEVLGVSVGELAKVLSQVFCDGGFEGDRTDGGGGFVGFTFAGAVLDQLDFNDDGVHSCEEYKKAYPEHMHRPGLRLPRPRCKLSERGKEMLVHINTGKRPARR
ncbi:kinesin-associated protein 3 [Scenedesmus sp. PABB004]|nr:kinesin-associated protein 3 [Scenedesmus sp. PABB004]